MTLVKTNNLKNLLEYFPKTSTSYVFGYGSGVFPQKNQKPGKMIDLIFVVDNPITWHQQNMEQNWTHYSFLKRFGAKTISRIQENFACGVYYNPFVRIDDKLIKYGVISTKALNDDLVNWRHMYVAGRLQKPVQDIKPPSTSILVNNLKQNRMAALRAVLLQLPPYATTYEVYYAITALSYIGDFRMYIGEHPHKIKNIVVPLMTEFDKIYIPLLESLSPSVTIDKERDRIVQKTTPSTKIHHLMALPTPIQIKLARKLKYNLSHHDLEEVIYNLSHSDSHIDKHVLQTMSKIVATSSIKQTIQGLFSAGIVKSVYYGFEKIMKRFGAGAAAKPTTKEESELQKLPTPHKITPSDIAEIELEQAEIIEAEAEIADAFRIAHIRPTFTSATILLHAVYIGDMEHIKFMDESKADWKIRDPNRCNVIHYAVIGGNPIVLQYVLSRIGNSVTAVNEKDVNGWSPLLRAVALSDNVELILNLLENGADPNTADTLNTCTPLFLASLMGKVEILELLLKYQADPFFTNHYGKSVLRMAYVLKRQDCIDILITAMKKINPSANVEPPTTVIVNGRTLKNKQQLLTDDIELAGTISVKPIIRSNLSTSSPELKSMVSRKKK